MSIHFDWAGALSVGKSTIDTQHRKLLSQLKKLVEAVVSDIPHEEVVAALAYFERYVNEHFSYE
jgi:hemerythrin